MKALLSRLNLDPYIASILGMVALASALPAEGRGMVVASDAGAAMIGLMFFLQGARLAPQAALAGARHWRLHAVVLACTFLLFPALGLTARAVAPGLLTPALWAGVLMLCVLPSTVQSSIAFTSIARGNVAAALCAATASNLLGILLTPLLAGLLLSAHGGLSARGVGDIAVQLLLPFAAGQLARPWIGEWVGRNKWWTSLVDRGSILLVVYVAFSEGVTHGIWHQLDSRQFSTLLLLDGALLAAILLATTAISRATRLQQGRSDHRRVLRLEEEPGRRPADGERAVRRPVTRPGGAAADAVPSTPAHGVRGAGATVCGGDDAGRSDGGAGPHHRLTPDARVIAAACHDPASRGIAGTSPPSARRSVVRTLRAPRRTRRTACAGCRSRWGLRSRWPR